MYAVIVMYVINHKPVIAGRGVAVVETEQQCHQLEQAMSEHLIQKEHVEPAAIWTTCYDVLVVDDKGDVHDTVKKDNGSEL